MAVSLVFHALVLFLLPVLKEAQRRIPAPPLTARLQAPKPPPPEPPKSEPLPPPVRPSPVARAARPVAAPPPILSIEPAKQAVEPAFVVPPQVPGPAPAAPAAAAAAQSASQPAAAAGSGLDPGAIARFRIELMKIAALDKKYPRIAQDNNWEGRVELRVVIGENGAISSLTVKKSAGRAVFDDEAQAMIRTAKAKIAIPPALRGTAFTLEIAVDFYLKDQ